MKEYFKEKVDVEFEDMLKRLKITKKQYILAVRSSIKRPQVFLKRRSSEVGVNGYNKDFLMLWEANIDVQFVADEYSAAVYTINYVSKDESGTTKLLDEAIKEVECGNVTLKEKFRKIANVFLNSNLMGAQEAVYHCLSLPLCKKSRGCVYINTNPRNERVMILKSNEKLQQLDPDSTDIVAESLVDKYCKRPTKLEKVCLADYAAVHYRPGKKDVSPHNDEGEDCETDDDLTNEQARRKIIRYRRYQKDQDPVNYYREQVMLFLPWRNEKEEIEDKNCKEIFERHKEMILKNAEKFSELSDETLGKAFENVQKQHDETISIEEEEDGREQNDGCHQVDIFEQAGKEIPKNKVENRLTCPQRIDRQEILRLLQNLNKKQRELVMHLLSCFKTGKTEEKILLLGSAGTGKSTVIKTIYQLLTYYFDNQIGPQKDNSVKVLLTAYSDKAAFLIDGVTLHTAFGLPVSKFQGELPLLSADVVNTLRAKLIDLKLLIIDEISMVGSTTFARVDTRLKQIMGKNKSFGGMSVLLVGDFNQLEPVGDKYIFHAPSDLSRLVGNSLWEEFKVFELEEIMRQKDDLDFTTALNNLSRGDMTEGDVQLIKSRSKRRINYSEFCNKIIL